MSALDILYKRAEEKVRNQITSEVKNQVNSEFVLRMFSKNLPPKEIADLLNLELEFVISVINSKKQ